MNFENGKLGEKIKLERRSKKAKRKNSRYMKFSTKNTAHIIGNEFDMVLRVRAKTMKNMTISLFCSVLI